jgi:lipid-binding SYLF domain-containing protein
MDLSLTKLASVAFKALNKESSILQTLNEDVQATVKRMAAEDPGLGRLLERAYGYAVFPSVGKAGAVVGGAFGKGEVFEKGRLVGYAGLVQVTVGVQIGGDTFSQIIAFESKEALDRFKRGRTAFAANASAVLVKAGAAKSARFEAGATVFISTEGGMMLEAAIGAQKFVFKPAAMGRTKTAPDPKPDNGTKSPRSRSDSKGRADRQRQPKPARQVKSKSTKGRPVRTTRSGRPGAAGRTKRRPGQSARRAAR